MAGERSHCGMEDGVSVGEESHEDDEPGGRI